METALKKEVFLPWNDELRQVYISLIYWEIKRLMYLQCSIRRRIGVLELKKREGGWLSPEVCNGIISS